jgi:hypothetical protein
MGVTRLLGDVNAGDGGPAPAGGAEGVTAETARRRRRALRASSTHARKMRATELQRSNLRFGTGAGVS